ncbi:unnamed protein product [Euphydryas editha]|uniref:Transposable element P transposase-like GTP-binding insertion domain-containing protein n=1 Tax=Euphydryas editha TaxID=104508 RepID=A0AAU9UNH1_EUPED|nr:unnamed protein product [Euphydryas editha]
MDVTSDEHHDLSVEIQNQKYVRQSTKYKSLAFEVDDIKIFLIFDVPHLLKGVRNNLIEKELRFVHNGQVKFSKWEHQKVLLEIDVGDDHIRLLNKLTKQHINKDKLPKMKVKYAAQVFSQRVSAALRFSAKIKTEAFLTKTAFKLEVPRQPKNGQNQKSRKYELRLRQL